MFLENVSGISLEHAVDAVTKHMGETDRLRRTRLGRMAVSGSNEVPAPQERRTTTADGFWLLWTAIGIGGIWVAVVLISLLSPIWSPAPNRSTAFTSWFWGGVGTLVFLWAMGRLRGDARWRPTWIGLSSVTLGIWAFATINAIALPVVETGSDPTQIPVGAVVGPVAAAMLTGNRRRRHERVPPRPRSPLKGPRYRTGERRPATFFVPALPTLSIGRFCST
jgi:hypothetical protein